MASTSIPERLKKIRLAEQLSQKALSRELGLGETTWQALELGKSTPSGETLLRLAERNYNPTWILTGIGEMRLDAISIKPIPHDGELLGRVISSISKLYKDEKVRLPDVDLGRLSMQAYAEITETTDDPDEYPARIELMVVRFRKALRAAAASPEASKRRA